MRGYAPGFNSNARPPGTGVNSPLDAQGHTALHLAVQKNDRGAMEKLLRVNANVNQQDKEGQTPLFEAVAVKNIALAKLLVEKGASFELRDDKKRNVLDWAIEKECAVEFIAQLKALGADPAAPAIENRRTAMHLAAEKNRPDLIEYLQSTGLSMNQQDSNGQTPLHIAVISKSMAAMEKLVELKADATIRNNQIESPLHLAATGGNVAAADALLALPEVIRGLNDHRTYGNGFTPLMAAVAANQPAIVEKIVSVGGNVNQTDSSNRNSLFIAVENGNVETARLLIRLGADVEKSAEGGYNRTPMVHGINDRNYSEMLVLLFNSGFNIDAKDASGVTALNRAADQQNKAKMKALLDLGADPNTTNSYGRRPLDTIMDNYTYTYTDHKEIIGMLVAKGADVSLSPNPAMQYAPLHLAARNGKLDDMKMILSRNAEIDQPARTPDGMTPYLLACESGKHDAAAFLQSQGADVFRKDAFGRGAIAFAARGGSEKVIAALLSVPGMEEHLNDQDARGRTATHDAFRKYHNDTGVFLITNGARLDVYDNEGLTPLHQAIATSYMSDFLDGVKIALGDKADWNLRMKDPDGKNGGDTLLHTAAKHNQAPVVEKLLDFGADPALPGRHGMIPLHVALATDNNIIVTRLLLAMAEKKIAPDFHRDDSGWGALHYAAVKNNGAAFVALVLAAGADVNAKSLTGDTALHVAARAGQMPAAQALLGAGADPLAQNAKGQTPLDIAMEMKRLDLAQALVIAAKEKEKPAAGAVPGATLNKWKPLPPPAKP